MPSAHQQGTGAQSVGAVASLSVPFGSNVTAGRTILAGVITYPSAGSTPRTHAVTGGGTYTGGAPRITGVTGDTSPAGEISYAHNATGGATTVTVTPSANAVMAMVIEEVSGVKNQAPVSTATGNTSSASPATGTLSLGGLTCFLFGVVTQNGGATTITPNTGGGWAQIFEDEDVTEMPINGQYRAATNTNQTAAWTFGASRAQLCVAAAFEDSAAAAAASLPPFLPPMRHMLVR